MKRLFLAFDLSDEAREAAADIQTVAKSQFTHSEITWVDPANFHITLHFIGDMQEVVIDDLRRVLREQEYSPAFDVQLEEAGAFPDKKSPKVLFVKTSFRTEAFGVVKQTANVLAGFGVKLDKRPWKPHITIGRMKKQAEVFKPEEIDVPEISFNVDHFTLYESRLTDDGSEYKVIETFDL